MAEPLKIPNALSGMSGLNIFEKKDIAVVIEVMPI
jgi:hypothetical protein